MIDLLYKHPLGLLTDLYQLTMSYGYFKNGMKDQEGVFNLFFRKNPFGGNYAIACGLKTAISYIKNFRFPPDDIAYLKTLKGNDGKVLFDEEFLDYLGNLSFSGDIDGIEEGRVVFPNEPLLRIKAPIILGQLLETPLLNILNFQTLIATKTARVCKSAGDDPVLEFGLRRAQGIDGALSATYASIVGGAQSTSNVLAGKLFDIPVKGTHAHSWVMSFPSEIEAFEKYSQAMPNNCVFLVDTYDTVRGVERAIETGKKLRQSGHEMIGIRLDSGDLADLSKKARSLLDSAGFQNAKIIASNDLNENRIDELKEAGARIDIWGVGTKLVTAYDQPALGGVYKLSAIKNTEGNWDYKVKKSEEMIKVSNPGILHLRRYFQDNQYAFDILYNEEFQCSDHFVSSTDTETKKIDSSLQFEEILTPIFREGQLVYQNPSLHETCKKREQDLEMLGESFNSNQKASKPYDVGLEEKLYQLKEKLLKQSVS